MIISIQNHPVRAKIAIAKGCLDVEFPEDPSHALAETVVIDLLQRNIGVIVASSFHPIGPWPEGLDPEAVRAMTQARLHAKGEAGRMIELFAPLKVLSH